MIKVECSFANKWELYDFFPTISAYTKHLEENGYRPEQFKTFCGVCGAGLAIANQEVEGRMRMDDYPTCTNPTCHEEYKE